MAIACHIGSQLTEVEPFAAAFRRVRDLVAMLRADGFDIQRLDLGGGLGVAYKPEDATPSIPDFVARLKARLAGHGLRVVLEPGRSIVAAAGVLLAHRLDALRRDELDRRAMRQVIEARNAAQRINVTGTGSAAIAQAEGALSGAVGRLFAVAENYPQLKSDATFMRLMDELSGTENRIATERQRYNERVQEYNTSRRQFPGNLTAKMFTFKDYPFFEAPPEAAKAPKVSFGKS